MTIPYAVPNPAVAEALQAATRVPVWPTASVELAIRCKASQERVLAMFAAMLDDNEDLWPATVEVQQ